MPCFDSRSKLSERRRIENLNILKESIKSWHMATERNLIAEWSNNLQVSKQAGWVSYATAIHALEGVSEDLRRRGHSMDSADVEP